MDEVEEADQAKDRGGITCKGKGRKDGVEYKGGNEQEDKGRGGGM